MKCLSAPVSSHRPSPDVFLFQTFDYACKLQGMRAEPHALRERGVTAEAAAGERPTI